MNYFFLKIKIILCVSVSVAAYNYRPFYEKNNFVLLKNSEFVIRSFAINVPGFPLAYNPSFIKNDDGYDLIFRYDPFYNKDRTIVNCFLGCVRLDKFFNPTETPILLDTGNFDSEDPRIFSTKEAVYISYVRVTDWSPIVKCDMCCSSFDTLNKRIVNSVPLRYSKGDLEKNWIPFVVNHNDKEDEIYFVYKYLPHRILKLTSIEDGIIEVVYNNEGEFSALKKWEEKWGKIRGGTPAILVGDEYLSFFHSSFKHKDEYYYVMGVITFENKPPFRIKKLSKTPIIFNDMYSIKVTKDAWFYGKRPPMSVIFPAGIAVGNENKKDVFYVVCGENDVGIRCVVIDRKTLLSSLELIGE